MCHILYVYGRWLISDSEVITVETKKPRFIALRLSFDMIHLYGNDLT